MKKIVFIPSYEPDEKLIELICELRKENLYIIVCNDGSGKEYDSIFQEIKKDVTLISYSKNEGKGYALKKGLSYINKHFQKPYVVVTMDSDGQHSVKDAKRLLDYSSIHPNEIVLGKRIRKETTPLRSKIGNAITHFIYKTVSGIDVYDTQTGLRSFSDQLVPFLLHVKGNRYEYEMNVLLFASKNNIPLKEIEIETIYIDGNKKSHFRTLKDSYLIYKEILKYSFSSIASFIIDYSLFLLMHLYLNLSISNILARIISSTFNFFFNKKIVFQSTNDTFIEATHYFLLVIIVLIINTILLNLFVSFKIPYYLSKILVELILFIFSWFIQKNYIFKRRDAL